MPLQLGLLIAFLATLLVLSLAGRMPLRIVRTADRWNVQGSQDVRKDALDKAFVRKHLVTQISHHPPLSSQGMKGTLIAAEQSKVDLVWRLPG